MSLTTEHKIPRVVGIWLLIGVIMVFIQVVIGGITRLTDSGLSITEWNIIKGVLPPLTEGQWQDAFQKYQDHTEQFEAIHANMSLKEFKVIFFWEYFHRLWARSMGFVFLIPFIIFWRKKWLPKALMRDLGLVVGLAALAAVFGWIMVSSGLNTKEYIWVDAYKLTIHLSIAITLLGFLFWAWLRTVQPLTFDDHNKRLRKFAWRITFVVALQLVLGGLMSGMKAGLVAPHFPHMSVAQDGSWIWIAEVLREKEQWTWANMFRYYDNAFAPSLIQLLHRGTAYLLCVLIPMFFFIALRLKAARPLRIGNYLLLIMLLIQFTLGVFTVMNSGNPDWLPTLGVLHQAGGMLLLLSILFVNYQFSKGGYKKSS